MTFREDSYPEMSVERQLLERLRFATQSDGANPQSFTRLLREIAKVRAWRKEGFEDFTVYIMTPVDAGGLGLSEDDFLRIADLGDEGVLARSLLGKTPHWGEIGGGHSRGDNIPSASTQRGTSKIHAIKRLKRDRPDLAKLVVSGKMSANAAAIEAGFRDRTLTIPADRPDRIVATLRRRLDPEQLAEVIRLLNIDATDEFS